MKLVKDRIYHFAVPENSPQHITGFCVHAAMRCTDPFNYHFVMIEQHGKCCWGGNSNNLTLSQGTVDRWHKSKLMWEEGAVGPHPMNLFVEEI